MFFLFFSTISLDVMLNLKLEQNVCFLSVSLATPFIVFGAEYRVKDNIVNVVNCTSSKKSLSSSGQLINSLYQYPMVDD